MGLLSKLFGNDSAEKIVQSIFSGNGQNGSQNNYTKLDPPVNTQRERSTSGDSWGEQMPAEENQFSSGMNYIDYFSKVFRDDFPQWQVQAEKDPRRDNTVFTFHQSGRIALIVEVMTEGCSSKKLRNQCRQSGVAYLRFYHNHYGWWNTRSYVSSRVRAALV